MSGPSDAELEGWMEIVLEVAKGFGDAGGRERRWFSCADIYVTYRDALVEFGTTGTVTSGAGQLVSNLPKLPNSNTLDTVRLDAVCDVLVAKGYLRRVENWIYRDAREITDEGRSWLARRILNAGAVPEENLPAVVVVTIRQDEFDAVTRRMKGRRLEQKPHRTYTRSVVERPSGAKLALYAIKTPEQGPIPAQDTTRDAIEDLDPRLILVVGIAGGVPETEFTLGDVVLGSRLHDFVVGAAKEGKAEVANQGGPMTKAVLDLISALPALTEKGFRSWSLKSSLKAARPGLAYGDDAFYGDDAWKADVRRGLAAQAKRTRPLLTARSIASSGMLVKDTGLLRLWRASSREICAVEMELAGVYAAAQRIERTYPVLAVRGVSDIVGLRREVGWTPYACETAASLAMAILRHGPIDRFLRAGTLA